MAAPRYRLCLLAALSLAQSAAHAQYPIAGARGTEGVNELPPPLHEENLSIRNEVVLSLQKAAFWLVAQEQPNGAWQPQDSPVPSALAFRALLQATPFLAGVRLASPARALDWMRPQATLGFGKLTVEQTAAILQALLANADPADAPLLRRGYACLQQQQLLDLPASAFHGGFSSPNVPPLADAQAALQALRSCLEAPARMNLGRLAKPHWQPAINFISRQRSAAEVGDPTPQAEALLAYLFAGLPVTDLRFQEAARAFNQALVTRTAPAQPPLAPQQIYLWAQTLPSVRSIEGERTSGNEPRDLALRLITTQAGSGAWSATAEPPSAEGDVVQTAAALLSLELLLPRL